jgi:hypothetical protein
MIEVYVIYTGKVGRVQIPGGPFANMVAAHDALEDYAVQHHNNWRTMRALLDAYGFIVQGAGSVHVQIRP